MSEQYNFPLWINKASFHLAVFFVQLMPVAKDRPANTQADTEPVLPWNDTSGIAPVFSEAVEEPSRQ